MPATGSAEIRNYYCLTCLLHPTRHPHPFHPHADQGWGGRRQNRGTPSQPPTARGGAGGASKMGETPHNQASARGRASALALTPALALAFPAMIFCAAPLPWSLARDPCPGPFPWPLALSLCLGLVGWPFFITSSHVIMLFFLC